MKKIHLLLMSVVAFAMSLGLTSCNDDNDLPNVDMSITISGAKAVDGTIYVVQGDTLTIDAITVKNLDSNKNAAITAATYYWDYYRLGTAMIPPYGFNIATTSETSLGKHLLEIESPVYAVDKAPAVGIQVYDVVVVSSEDEIPSGTITTTVSNQTRIAENS